MPKPLKKSKQEKAEEEKDDLDEEDEPEEEEDEDEEEEEDDAEADEETDEEDDEDEAEEEDEEDGEEEEGTDEEDEEEVPVKPKRGTAKRKTSAKAEPAKTRGSKGKLPKYGVILADGLPKKVEILSITARNVKVQRPGKPELGLKRFLLGDVYAFDQEVFDAMVELATKVRDLKDKILGKTKSLTPLAKLVTKSSRSTGQDPFYEGE